MARGKRYQPEQVVNLLRQIEMAVANGKTTGQGHAALPADTARRRRSSDSGHRCSCQSVWTLRVSPDHGAAGACRLEGGQGPGRTHDGRSVRILNLIDESTRECLQIRAEWRWSSAKVIGALADVMVMKGVPEYLRSDNGPEYVPIRAQRHCTSNPAPLGRTASANRSTQNLGMSSSAANFSTR